MFSLIRTWCFRESTAVKTKLGEEILSVDLFHALAHYRADWLSRISRTRSARRSVERLRAQIYEGVIVGLASFARLPENLQAKKERQSVDFH